MKVHFVVRGCVNNKTAWGTKLLLTAVWAHPVDWTSSCYLLKAQHCYLSPNGCFTPPSAPHLPPPPTSIPLRPTHTLCNQSVILQELKKNYLKTSSIQVTCRNSYKMIAIYLHYLYNIYGVTVLYHKKRTVCSIFQISIFRNTKCVI